MPQRVKGRSAAAAPVNQAGDKKKRLKKKPEWNVSAEGFSRMVNFHPN
jgi:hypothetical protein